MFAFIPLFSWFAELLFIFFMILFIYFLIYFRPLFLCFFFCYFVRYFFRSFFLSFALCQCLVFSGVLVLAWQCSRSHLGGEPFASCFALTRSAPPQSDTPIPALPRQVDSPTPMCFDTSPSYGRSINPAQLGRCRSSYRFRGGPLLVPALCRGRRRHVEGADGLPHAPRLGVPRPHGGVADVAHHGADHAHSQSRSGRAGGMHGLHELQGPAHWATPIGGLTRWCPDGVLKSLFPEGSNIYETAGAWAKTVEHNFGGWKHDCPHKFSTNARPPVRVRFMQARSFVKRSNKGCSKGQKVPGEQPGQLADHRVTIFEPIALLFRESRKKHDV